MVALKLRKLARYLEKEFFIVLVPMGSLTKPKWGIFFCKEEDELFFAKE